VEEDGDDWRRRDEAGGGRRLYQGPLTRFRIPKEEGKDGDEEEVNVEELNVGQVGGNRIQDDDGNELG